MSVSRSLFSKIGVLGAIENSEAKINFSINIFIFLLGVSSIFFSLINLYYYNSSLFISFFNVGVGFFLIFLMISRNVYYKRYKNLVSIIVEEKLPIYHQSYTNFEYDETIVTSKKEDYKQIDFNNDEEVDVTVIR